MDFGRFHCVEWGVSHTAVDNVVLVQVVDCTEDLFDGLGGILLGELPLLADTIEELTARSELSDDVEFVL